MFLILPCCFYFKGSFPKSYKKKWFFLNYFDFREKILDKSPLFRYPKLMLFCFCILLAFFLFQDSDLSNFLSRLGALNYFGVLLAGFLYAFGLTSPFATGFFILAKPTNIFLAALLGGFGALCADIIIFRFIKFSFEDEFLILRQTGFVRGMGAFFSKLFGEKAKQNLSYVVAGFFIASPVPDEAGLMMVAGFTKINNFQLSIISFTLNTLGILTLLLL